jgi:hypothetical protein
MKRQHTKYAWRDLVCMREVEPVADEVTRVAVYRKEQTRIIIITIYSKSNMEKAQLQQSSKAVTTADKVSSSSKASVTSHSPLQRSWVAVAHRGGHLN